MTSDSPRAARVLWACALGAFAIGASQAGSGGVIVEQAHELRTSVEVIGYSLASYALGVVVSAPTLTILMARWDRRRIMLVMATVAVVMSIATAFAPNPAALIAIRFFAGFPHGVLLGAAATVGAHVLGPARRGTAVARIMIGFTVALVVATPAMKFVAHEWGWRWAYVGVIGASALALLAMWAWIPSVKAADGARWREDLSHLRGGPVWGAVAAAGLGFAGLATINSYVTPLLQEGVGLTVTAVTIVLVAQGLAMTVGTLSAGKVADNSPLLAARIGFVASLLLLVALGWWGGIAPVGIALVLLVAICTSFASQGLQNHFMDVIHASPTLGAALSHSALNVANTIGSALGAVLIGASLGYLSLAWAAALISVLGIAIVFFAPGFRHNQGRRPPRRHVAR